MPRTRIPRAAERNTSQQSAWPPSSPQSCHGAIKRRAILRLDFRIAAFRASNSKSVNVGPKTYSRAIWRDYPLPGCREPDADATVVRKTFRLHRRARDKGVRWISEADALFRYGSNVTHGSAIAACVDYVFTTFRASSHNYCDLGHRGLRTHKASSPTRGSMTKRFAAVLQRADDAEQPGGALRNIHRPDAIDEPCLRGRALADPARIVFEFFEVAGSLGSVASTTRRSTRQHDR